MIPYKTSVAVEQSKSSPHTHLWQQAPPPFFNWVSVEGYAPKL